jgi:hypothetical protein
VIRRYSAKHSDQPWADQMHLDEIVVIELAKVAAEYVQMSVNRGDHPIDALMNATSVLDFYLEAKT